MVWVVFYPVGLCLGDVLSSGVMSRWCFIQWGFVQVMFYPVGFCPGDVLSGGVMSGWRMVYF